jgi:carbohydrate diacid regulator
MHHLDGDLAQRIVERSMGVVDRNVNVMDAGGVILGSGEPERLGSVHEGALLAVTQGREVAIDAASAGGLHGVKPGVNLPLRWRDEVIGAVGITGDPEEVGVLGGLIRVTAELMVEQAQVLEAASWQRREREDFLARVVGADLDGDEVERLSVWAGQLELDPDGTWLVVVVDAELRSGEGAGTGSWLASLRGQPGVATVLPSPEGLVVLLDAAALTGPAEDVVAPHPGTTRRIAVGATCPGVVGIARSHRSALDALWVAGRTASRQTVVRHGDVAAATLAAGLRHTWRADLVAAPWRRLVEADRHGDLARTFAAYCRHFGDQAACAEELHVHRNTLRYRLHRIEQVTGLRLTQVDDLLSLYLGSLLT